ncbi:hypothetical protein M9Y10_026700 [Tritrichomonas musculus]|uniref:Nucleotide-diphospho-sugar transferase domain-containing protein n=1 Tax=Tritrichomonas musculus TaxID=1915356 RepID=A0ABR2H6A9_9EUKA
MRGKKQLGSQDERERNDKNIKIILLNLFQIIYLIISIIILYIKYQKISSFAKLLKEDLVFKCNTGDVIIFTNPKWTIPRAFLRSLKNSINQFPINEKTGHPFIMIAATTGWPYIWYTLNYYCSLRLRIPSNYYLFIAMDDESYNEMRSRGIPTIQYSHKPPKSDITTESTVLRMAIVYQLLQWKVDVLVTDTDMVFFENPLTMFDNVSDFEVSYEMLNFLPDYKNHEGYWGNLGFWRVNSNEKSLVFIKNLFEWCFKLKTHDQNAFHGYLKTQKGEWLSDTVFIYKLSDLNMNWSIHYLDNLQITLSNSIFCGKNRRAFTKEALRRNISMPIIFHLAWYWPTRKASVLYEKNAWFVDFPHSRDCKAAPPKGTQFFWDNKFDLPDSPQIPKKFPVNNFPH